MKSFLGVTCHFYADNLLRSVTIGVKELCEPYKSEYLEECLRDVITEWNIPLENVTAITTDNCKNIVKASTNIFRKNKHLPCFVHTLDLVATKIIDDVEAIKNVITKIKAIVTHLKQSILITDELSKSSSPREMF